MRIARIHIEKFAAIEGLSFEPTPITVIQGPNESNKTMLLDALLEALFARGRLKGQFHGMERYSEGDSFRGEVALVMDGGGEHIFPGKVNLEGLLNLPRLSARNLMVARSGALDFYEKKGEWWGSVKELLMGFEGGLGKVEELIRKDVGLTPKDDWVNRQGQRIRHEVESLQERESALRGALADAEGISQLQIELHRQERELGESKDRLGTLRGARERERYRSAIGLIDDYRGFVANLSQQGKYREMDYSDWLEQERRLAETGERTINLDDRREGLQRRIEERRGELESLASEIRQGEEQEVRIFPEIDRRLQAVQARRAEAERASSGEPLTISGTLGACAAAVVFLFLALDRGGAYYIGLAAFAAAFLFMALRWTGGRRLRQTLKAMEGDLSGVVSQVAPGVQGAAGAKEWLGEQRRARQRRTGEKARLEEDLKVLEGDLRGTLERLSEVRNTEKKISRRITELRETTGCSSPQELNVALNNRRDLERSAESLREEITRLLEVEEEGHWPQALNRLKPYADVEGEWDPEEARRLEGGVEELDRWVAANSSRLASAKESLIRAGCSTPEDVFIELDRAVVELEEYRLRREAALAAIGVLKGLAAEQDTLINSVITGGPRSAQDFFSRITGGRYTGISRRGDIIEAWMPDGRTFPIDRLSTGTQAQLYFALRVGLITRVLGSETPFLLLDDPFLSSDEGRLEVIMDFLIQLAKDGWQLIYFTVDRRVAARLSSAGEGLCSSISLSA